MFKVQRQNRDPRSGERFDFKFSNFQAIQVPKGWDKLLVSVVSVETGKTIAKSSKAHVRNGNCQWTETLSESIWISHDESTAVLEERLFKFVVSMGSARSGILGEVTVNLAEYITKKAPPPVLMPLQKCNYGSILQVKIQCLTPKTKLRTKDSNNSSYSAEDHNGNHQDLQRKSDCSDDSLARSSGSLSSKDLGSTSHPGELISREASFSSSVSHHSFGSADSHSRRGNVSVRNEVNGGRQNSSSSLNSSRHTDYHADDSYRSNPSSFKSRASDPGNDPQNQWQESAQTSARFTESPSLTNGGSSKNYLEVAEDTINELRGEAKMWERNSRKQTVDLDILRKELSDLSKKQEDKDMELLAACAERDGLRKEVDQLKLLLEATRSKQVDPGSPCEGSIRVQKDMETEIKYQRECNANLTQQLKRSQESNVELVDILHELEETIEKQKVDMANFSALQMKVSEMESSLQQKIEENKYLSLQMQESEKACIQNNQTIGDIETEYRNKLLLKDKEIANLERKLSEYSLNKLSEEVDSSHGSKEDLIREIEALKEKLEELEQDCNELTNENMDLLYKLKNSSMNCAVEPTSPGCGLRAISFSMSKPVVKDPISETQELKEEHKEETIEKDQIADLVEQLEMAFHQLKKPWHSDSSHLRNGFKSDPVDFSNLRRESLTAPKEFVNTILSSLIGLNNLLEARIDMCDEWLRNGDLKIEESKYDVAEAQQKLEDHILKEKNLNLYIQELESINTDLRDNLAGLEKELIERGSSITTCEAKMLSDDNEIRFLRQSQEELEAQICELRKEKDQIEGNMKTLLQEIQKQRDDLEEENMKLSEQVSSLEAQLRLVAEERESDRLEVTKSQSVALGLEDEIRRLGTEMEEDKFDLNNKLKHTEDQLSEAKEGCENLKMEIQKLLVSAEDLTAECNSLEKENGLLRRQESEFREQCTRLETQLKESQIDRFELSEQIEALKETVSSMLEDFSLKERNLASELDVLLKEKKNLQREIEQLKENISFTRDEGERIASEAAQEVSSLRASNARLEYSLQEIQSKVSLAENEIDAVRKDSQLNVQDLVVELSTTRKSHELLVADYEKKLKSLGSFRSSEEKMNNSLNDLELKLTVSECERQQLIEEISNLKTQLQEATHVQDEYSKRTEALEEQLRVMEERMKAQNQSRSEKGDTYSLQNGSPHACEIDQTERIQLLESELAHALEADNKFKIRLQRLSSEGKNNDANGLEKPTAEGEEVVPKERFERTKSSLETELKDLRERYSLMSLQYAEVEAEREELVMKLKAKSGKKWF